MERNSTRLPFRRAAVIGAGTMGAQIAAHLANAGVEVLLLDLASKDSDPRALVKKRLKDASKLKPNPFFKRPPANVFVVERLSMIWRKFRRSNG